MRKGFPVVTMGSLPDCRASREGDSGYMTVKLDVSEVGTRLEALHQASLHRAHGTRESIAVVVPLAEGRAEVVEEFLAEGPPFDPKGIGLESHQVFLTDREAVFVFDTVEGARAFERILAEPDFWDVVPAWEHSVSAEPRIGTLVYEWRESQS